MNSKPNMIFLNRSFDKKRLKALLLWFRLNLSEGAALKAVEILQGLGFRSATQGAISLGLDDLKTPASKGGRVFQAQLEVALAHHEHHRGNRTPVELFQHLVDTWHRTSQDLTAEVVQLFHSTERVNPVYMMAFSGARGNISQVRQLVGMRGLMADPRGQIVGFPILSNFREGLTITEYFVSCYGARKGVVDTAIRTADAGYLTRRLADVSHHVVVRTTNCGTHRNIRLRDIKEGQKTILSLSSRLVGRVLAEHVALDSKNLPKTSNVRFLPASQAPKGEIEDTCGTSEGGKEDPASQAQRGKKPSVVTKSGETIGSYLDPLGLAKLPASPLGFANSPPSKFSKAGVDLMTNPTSKVSKKRTEISTAKHSSGRTGESVNPTSSSGRPPSAASQALGDKYSLNSAPLISENSKKVVTGFLPQRAGEAGSSLPPSLVPHVHNSISNKFAFRDEEITPDLAAKLALQYLEISVRSPLSCSLRWGVCQLCYGWGLSEGRRVTLGEAVGIIAAQSIGEPGTQLTLRTFHTGGVFSGDLLNEIRAPYIGMVFFPQPLQGLLVRTPHGQIAFLTKVAGKMIVSSTNNTLSATQAPSAESIEGDLKNDKLSTCMEDPASPAQRGKNPLSDSISRLTQLSQFASRSFLTAEGGTRTKIHTKEQEMDDYCPSLGQKEVDLVSSKKDDKATKAHHALAQKHFAKVLQAVKIPNNDNQLSTAASQALNDPEVDASRFTKMQKELAAWGPQEEENLMTDSTSRVNEAGKERKNNIKSFVSYASPARPEFSAKGIISGNGKTRKQDQEFLLQPSTVIFVRQKEQVYQNQLLAEFSSSTLQSTNDQIEVTQQVLSETAGQVWFKEIHYGNRKGPGSGPLGTHFSSQKLGGIWVLAGSPMPISSPFNHRQPFLFPFSSYKEFRSFSFNPPASQALTTKGSLGAASQALGLAKLPALIARGVYPSIYSYTDPASRLTPLCIEDPVSQAQRGKKEAEQANKFPNENCFGHQRLFTTNSLQRNYMHQNRLKNYKISIINLQHDYHFFKYHYLLGYSQFIRCVNSLSNSRNNTKGNLTPTVYESGSSFVPFVNYHYMESSRSDVGCATSGGGKEDAKVTHPSGGISKEYSGANGERQSVYLENSSLTSKVSSGVSVACEDDLLTTFASHWSKRTSLSKGALASVGIPLKINDRLCWNNLDTRLGWRPSFKKSQQKRGVNFFFLPRLHIRSLSLSTVIPYGAVPITSAKVTLKNNLLSLRFLELISTLANITNVRKPTFLTQQQREALQVHKLSLKKYRYEINGSMTLFASKMHTKGLPPSLVRPKETEGWAPEVQLRKPSGFYATPASQVQGNHGVGKVTQSISLLRFATDAKNNGKLLTALTPKHNIVRTLSTLQNCKWKWKKRGSLKSALVLGKEDPITLLIGYPLIYQLRSLPSERVSNEGLAKLTYTESVNKRGLITQFISKQEIEDSPSKPLGLNKVVDSLTLLTSNMHTKGLPPSMVRPKETEGCLPPRGRPEVYFSGIKNTVKCAPKVQLRKPSGFYTTPASQTEGFASLTPYGGDSANMHRSKEEVEIEGVEDCNTVYSHNVDLKHISQKAKGDKILPETLTPEKDLKHIRNSSWKITTLSNKPNKLFTIRTPLGCTSGPVSQAIGGKQYLVEKSWQAGYGFRQVGFWCSSNSWEYLFANIDQEEIPVNKLALCGILKFHKNTFEMGTVDKAHFLLGTQIFRKDPNASLNIPLTWWLPKERKTIPGTLLKEPLFSNKNKSQGQLFWLLNPNGSSQNWNLIWNTFITSHASYSVAASQADCTEAINGETPLMVSAKGKRGPASFVSSMPASFASSMHPLRDKTLLTDPTSRVIKKQGASQRACEAVFKEGKGDKIASVVHYPWLFIFANHRSQNVPVITKLVETLNLNCRKCGVTNRGIFSPLEQNHTFERFANLICQGFVNDHMLTGNTDTSSAVTSLGGYWDGVEGNLLPSYTDPTNRVTTLTRESSNKEQVYKKKTFLSKSQIKTTLAKQKINKLLTINPFWQALSLTNYPNQRRSSRKIDYFQGYTPLGVNNSSDSPKNLRLRWDVPPRAAVTPYGASVAGMEDPASQAQRGKKEAEQATYGQRGLSSKNLTYGDVKEKSTIQRSTNSLIQPENLAKVTVDYIYRFPTHRKQKGKNKILSIHKPVWLSIHISSNNLSPFSLTPKVFYSTGLLQNTSSSLNPAATQDPLGSCVAAVQPNVSTLQSNRCQKKTSLSKEIFSKSTSKIWNMRNNWKVGTRKKQIERNDGSLDQHIVHTVHLPVVPFPYIIQPHCRYYQGASSLSPSVVPKSVEVPTSPSRSNGNIYTDTPTYTSSVTRATSGVEKNSHSNTEGVNIGCIENAQPCSNDLTNKISQKLAALSNKQSKSFGKLLSTGDFSQVTTSYHSNCGTPVQGNLLPLIRQSLWEESCNKTSLLSCLAASQALGVPANPLLNPLGEVSSENLRSPKKNGTLPIRIIINSQGKYTSTYLKLPHNNRVAFTLTLVNPVANCSFVLKSMKLVGSYLTASQAPGLAKLPASPPLNPLMGNASRFTKMQNKLAPGFQGNGQEFFKSILLLGARSSTYLLKKSLHPLYGNPRKHPKIRFGLMPLKYSILAHVGTFRSFIGRSIPPSPMLTTDLFFGNRVLCTEGPASLAQRGKKGNEVFFEEENDSTSLQELPYTNCFSLMQRTMEYPIERSTFNRWVTNRRRKLKYSPFSTSIPNKLFGFDNPASQDPQPNNIVATPQFLPLLGGLKGQNKDNELLLTRKGRPEVLAVDGQVLHPKEEENSLPAINKIFAKNKKFIHLGHPIYLNWYACHTFFDQVKPFASYYPLRGLASHQSLSRFATFEKSTARFFKLLQTIPYPEGVRDMLFEIFNLTSGAPLVYPSGVRAEGVKGRAFSFLKTQKPMSNTPAYTYSVTRATSGPATTCGTNPSEARVSKEDANSGACEAEKALLGKEALAKIAFHSVLEAFSKSQKSTTGLTKPILSESDQVTFVGDYFVERSIMLPKLLSPYGASVAGIEDPASQALKGKKEADYSRGELKNSNFSAHLENSVTQAHNTFDLFPGQLIAYGENINNSSVTTESGQVLYIDSQKTTLRKAQTVLIYSQAIIAVLSGEWIRKGTPLMALSYQKLVTGDIVQGLPKIEQFFEAPVLKDGTFWGDSLQAKLNEFFQEHREQLPLAEAVRKGFSEIQRVLIEGVQRVYISQGVLIADKHLEVIVRQMTCKGRILYSGDTGFLRNELVSLDKIESVNQVTYGQKALYHPQVRGITDASLESESFLSAASFQETTRVLSRDAIIGKTDLMRGLKERVIVGELVQAGTGLANNNVYSLL